MCDWEEKQFALFEEWGRIGSRSQEVSGEPDKSAENSLIVARWKQGNSGGLKAGGRCGEEVVVPDRNEDQSLWILSEKNVAKDWGKEFRVKDEGNEGLTILCT